MISDSSLYSLAVFLGAASMLMIVLYHFLEINSDEHSENQKVMIGAGGVKDSVNVAAR
ncbi:uncharacterized protein MYCFIDRAFT_43711 [Pseudocercospora fijiensis CIRAD86]|uniref:Dolichyl-diphosphooligosaccharide--protein glycosyltransferase subunit 4 n=1 Tax=Pseudocercospora fijiensis (strain CIRAD86) TaxID=383855 RepID=M2ZIG1_PSEFD|nr:uncharacterized protein MYCFIDRAFT_43711 [Pseudocercospora fijiensis CIRAD86]EME78904.1 hypothetical protein MYCFIDRAFT_43711 [Pseudocercospora fijiensis CIRAD86]